MIKEKISSLHDSIKKIREKKDRLKIYSPRDGVWLDSDLKKFKGVFFNKGDQLGFVAKEGENLIRAIASQEDSQLIRQAEEEVEIRVKGRPEDIYEGQVIRNFQAGRSKLPSAALGYAVGGEIITKANTQDGRDTAEKFFEIHVLPIESDKKLYAGQVLILRFTLSEKTLLRQGLRQIKQVFQKRYNIL